MIRQLWSKAGILSLYNDGEFPEDTRGKHVRYQVMFDEEYHDKALEWVHSHCSVKGKPNMIASNFSE